MRYHNTHQPPNVYNENQASRTNPGHQGQFDIFGGQGSHLKKLCREEERLWWWPGGQGE